MPPAARRCVKSGFTRTFCVCKAKRMGWDSNFTLILKEKRIVPSARHDMRHGPRSSRFYSSFGLTPPMPPSSKPLRSYEQNAWSRQAEIAFVVSALSLVVQWTLLLSIWTAL